MKSKMVKMVFALIVLGVLSGAYFGVKSYVTKQEEKEEASKEENPSVFSVDVDKIKSVSFFIDKKETVFEKDGDSWIKQDEKEFPVNENTITNAVGVFPDMKADRILEDVENLNEYGLDSPQNTVTITTEDDETIVMRIGIENESTSQYYISKDEDRHTVYVVPTAYAEPFMNSLYDYAEMEEFPSIDASKIKKIAVKEGDSSYELKKDEDTGLWNVSDGKISESTDTSKVNNLTSAISTLAYDEFVDYHADNLSEYGLDDPYATVTVDYEEAVEEASEDKQDNEGADSGEIESDEAKMEQKQLIFLIGDETNGDCRYVMIGESNQVYTMTADALSTLLGKNVSDYWSMTVNYLSVNNLEQLEVERKGEKHLINVSRETSENEDGEKEETISYQLDETELEETAFTTFYNKLINMSGQKRLEEKFTSEDEPEMSIVFKDLDNEETKVTYYEYDTNFYAAVINNKTYLINKMTVREMLEAYDSMLAN